MNKSDTGDVFVFCLLVCLALGIICALLGLK